MKRTALLSEVSESQFLSLFTKNWLTLDSHTAGESTRLIMGYPQIPGRTINEKRLYLLNHDDNVRLLLCREPRGNRETISIILTEPVTKGASFGLIYMDARRYPYLCGHGTIGAVTSLIEAGVIQVSGSEAKLCIDTPAGVVEATAHLNGKEVRSVSIHMVPSFVYATDKTLELPESGTIQIDIVYAGGFFAMISTNQLEMELSQSNVDRLIPLGMKIIAAANEQLVVQHPTQSNVTTIDVAEFYDPAGHPQNKGKNLVIYGESHVDRSPCGTGTAAKLALLSHEGAISMGKLFHNKGILDTEFTGKVVSETNVGMIPAVVCEITGSAYLTGYHRFVLDTKDPFQEGFLL